MAAGIRRTARSAVGATTTQPGTSGTRTVADPPASLAMAMAYFKLNSARRAARAQVWPRDQVWCGEGGVEPPGLTTLLPFSRRTRNGRVPLAWARRLPWPSTASPPLPSRHSLHHCAYSYNCGAGTSHPSRGSPGATEARSSGEAMIDASLDDAGVLVKTASELLLKVICPGSGGCCCPASLCAGARGLVADAGVTRRGPSRVRAGDRALRKSCLGGAREDTKTGAGIRHLVSVRLRRYCGRDLK